MHWAVELVVALGFPVGQRIAAIDVIAFRMRTVDLLVVWMTFYGIESMNFVSLRCLKIGNDGLVQRGLGGPRRQL